MQVRSGSKSGALRNRRQSGGQNVGSFGSGGLPTGSSSNTNLQIGTSSSSTGHVGDKLYNDLPRAWKLILSSTTYLNLLLVVADLALAGLLWIGFIDRFGPHALWKFLHRFLSFVISLLAALTANYLYIGFGFRRRSYIDHHGLPDAATIRTSQRLKAGALASRRVGTSSSLKSRKWRPSSSVGIQAFEPMQRLDSPESINSNRPVPFATVRMNYTRLLRIQFLLAISMVALPGSTFFLPHLNESDVGRGVFSNLQFIDTQPDSTNLTSLILLDDIQAIQRTGKCCGFYGPEDWPSEESTASPDNNSSTARGCPNACADIRVNVTDKDGTCLLQGCRGYINEPIEMILLIVFIVYGLVGVLTLLAWSCGLVMHEQLRRTAVLYNSTEDELLDGGSLTTNSSERHFF